MKLTDSDKEKIANMRRNGFGYRRIAKFLGFKENTIKSYLRYHEIEGATPLIVRPDIDGYCKNCGIPIAQTPNKRKRLYCSDKCRLQAWHREKKKAEGEEIVPAEKDTGDEDIVAIGETAEEDNPQRQERTLLKLTVDMEIALTLLAEIVGVDKLCLEQMRSEYTLELAQRQFLGKSKTNN